MNTFVIKDLKYHKTMRPYYSLLCELPGFVLLESAGSEKGRYDILSACPYENIRIHAGDDIQAILNHLENRLPYRSTPLDLPFQGGAIGYVTYDLGERLMGIHSPPQQGLADMPLLDMGLYDWALITDHQQETVTLFAANTQVETQAIIDDVLLLLGKEACVPSFHLTEEFAPLQSQDFYNSAFRSIHSDLKKGRSYQVNYTQPFIGGYEGDSWALYDQIISKNPVPFAAYLKKKDSTILSFSPERYLLLNEQQQLLASPIKGTVKRSLNPDEDFELQSQLKNCPKNRAENIMIVDLLRNDLGKIAKPGSVQVTSLCEVQSYNGVHHLVSDIQADCLPSVSPLQAFLSCFPGGSITGAPKLEAMRIINEQEPFSRGVYCGAVAYFSAHGRFDSNIAIRTIVDKNHQLHLSAGGGIVIDSKASDEYLECFTKVSAIVKALAKV